MSLNLFNIIFILIIIINTVTFVESIKNNELISLLAQISKTRYIRKQSNDIFAILAALGDFLFEHSDVQFFDTKEGDECISAFLQSNDTYFDLFSFSGKGISELGLEAECYLSKKASLTYYLFMYQYNTTSFDTFSDDGYVYKFMNHTTFYTGICIYQKCSSWIEKMFNRTNNPKFYDYIQKEALMRNVVPLKGNNTFPRYYNAEDNVKPLEYWLFLIIINIILVLFILQIIIGILTVCIFSAQNKNSKQNLVPYKNYNLDSSFDENEEEEESDIILTKNFETSIRKERETIFGSKEINDNQKEETCQKCPCQKCMSKVIDFFSFISNLSLLSSKKNKYFNDKDLEVISFLKVIVLIFITFFHNFDTLIKIPARDFANGAFYKSYWFFFIKISGFASECWISLDGFTMIYKFMHYLKKNMYEKGDNSISFKVLSTFYLRALAKLIVFIILYCLTGLCAQFLLWLFSKDTLYNYTSNKIFNLSNVETLEKFIIPGYNLYMSYSTSYEARFFAYNKMLVMLVNEFYIFTFVLILIYIGFKIRSKIWDFVIVLVFLANYGLTMLTCPADITFEGDYYNFNKIVRSLHNVRYPHLMFNNYMIGLFTGLACFYFKDVISKSSITNENNTYCPFKFCYHLVKFIDTFDPIIKKIITYLDLILLLVFSMSFSFMVTTNNDLLIEERPFSKFLFYYEKGIFLFIFNFLILLLETYSDNSSLKHLINASIFVVFSRTSFCYLCCMNCFIYGAYCLFYFQLKLCYQNLWFISFGLFMFCYFFSLVLTILIEVPIRVSIKNLIFFIESKSKLQIKRQASDEGKKIKDEQEQE